jgi:hypothetical protein
MHLNQCNPAYLRQVIYNFGENMSYEGFVAGDLLSQHRTALDFNLFDRHALKSPQLEEILGLFFIKIYVTMRLF